MKPFKFASCGLASLGAALLLLQPVQAATLPPAPAGFVWELQGTDTYSASDSASGSVTLSQNLRPSADPPVVTGISQSLSVAPFNPAAEEASRESAMPGMNFHIQVLDSTYNISVAAAATVDVFNFDSGDGEVSGGVGLSGWKVTGNASAGPVTDTLINSAQPVGAFAVESFKDETSGSNTASVNISVSGAAATGPTPLNFGVGGSFFIGLSGTGNNTSNFEFGAGTASYTSTASVDATYEIWKLVPVPEPAVGLLGLVSAGFLLLRRSRGRC